MNLARLLWMGFGLITAWAIMTIPFASLGLQYLGAPRVVIAVSLVVGLIVLLVAVTAARPIARYGTIVADAIERVPRRWFLLAVLVGGIFLRVLWIGYFPAPLQSDSAVYVALARGLIENGIYVDRLGQRGYWPPGYPFLLYACFLIVGVHAWVPIAVNVILYAAAVYIVYRLGRMVACERVGRLAALLLTLWPNYIFLSGYPTKESFAILLIPLALLFYVSATAPGVSPVSMLVQPMSWFIVDGSYELWPAVAGFWCVLKMSFQPAGPGAALPSSPATLPLLPPSTSMSLRSWSS